MAQLPAKQLGTRDVTSVSRNAKITLQYGTSQFKVALYKQDVARYVVLRIPPLVHL